MNFEVSKIMDYLNQTGKKLTKEEIRKKLGVSYSEVEAFEKGIKELEETGKLYLDDKGFYHVFSGLCGAVKLSATGEGYINIYENDHKKKYMIPNDQLFGAQHGDFVIIIDNHRKKEGLNTAFVHRVLKRNQEKRIFRYLGNGEFEIYGSDSKVKFTLPLKECSSLVEGTLVLAQFGKELLSTDGNYVQGEIIKVAGHVDDPKAQIRAIGLRHGFDNQFSDTINKIVQKMPTEVTVEETIGRVDLRDEMIFTIDGKDTKDIDDAVSIQKTNDGYILKVSIADVSHYVKDIPLLFEEALLRGNSAYLADSVFPMFPHKISNGICSLNPNEDRLAKTVEIKYDNEGNVLDSRVYKSVINSKKKMNYSDVNKVLSGELVLGYEEFVASLKMMSELSGKLTKKHEEKGSLSFGKTEVKTETNRKGKAVDLKVRENGESQKIIENFMIAANVEVTNLYCYLDCPFIFRVHDQPDVEKLREVLEVLKEQDLADNKILINVQNSLENSRIINPMQLAPLLNVIEDEERFEAVSNLLLRVMKKANYSPKNIGHFGLAEDNYTHFTSPIRRAADLVIHTIIDYVEESYYCAGSERFEQIEEELDYLKKNMASICENLSLREREADKAERETYELTQMQYVLDNIEDYEGPVPAVIQHMNRSGIWVKINHKIKAMIELDDVYNEGYDYKYKSRTYVNPKLQDTLHLGDTIYVLDPEVSLEMRSVLYHRFGRTEEDIFDLDEVKTYQKRRNQ